MPGEHHFQSMHIVWLDSSCSVIHVSLNTARFVPFARHKRAEAMCLLCFSCRRRRWQPTGCLSTGTFDARRCMQSNVAAMGALSPGGMWIRERGVAPRAWLFSGEGSLGLGVWLGSSSVSCDTTGVCCCSGLVCAHQQVLKVSDTNASLFLCYVWLAMHACLQGLPCPAGLRCTCRPHLKGRPQGLHSLE